MANEDVVDQALARKKQRDEDESLVRWDLRVPPDVDDEVTRRATSANVTRTGLVVAVLREVLFGGR